MEKIAPDLNRRQHDTASVPRPLASRDSVLACFDSIELVQP
jgi:hypothetical protein